MVICAAAVIAPLVLSHSPSASRRASRSPAGHGRPGSGHQLPGSGHGRPRSGHGHGRSGYRRAPGSLAARTPILAGYPRASTTGVPARRRLLRVPGQVSRGPGWYYDSRGYVLVYGRGAVLSGLDIDCGVSITGSHVTITGDLIVVGGHNAIGVALRRTADVTIEDSTIRGLNPTSGRMMAGIKDVFGDSSGTVIRGNDISLAETGIQINSGLIVNNYIHNPGYQPGDHTNGITSNGGGSAPLTIEHNTILINRSQTDAIGLFEDFGIQQNRRIADNLLAGGDYVIYAGQRPGGPVTRNIVITGNRIISMFYPRGGHFGCIAHFDRHGPGDTWSDNRWNSTIMSAGNLCD